MSDKNHTSVDFSQNSDYYKGARKTSNPLERISEPSVPGIFRIRNKEHAVLPSITNHTLKKITGSALSVGMEVGVKKEVLEEKRRKEEEKDAALKLLRLAEAAGIEIRDDGSGGISLAVPENFFQGEDAKTEKKLQRLIDLQSCIVALAKLDERLEILDLKSTPASKLNKFYTLKESITWLTVPPEKWPDEPGAIENSMSIASIHDALKEMNKELASLEKEYGSKTTSIPIPAPPLTSTDTPKPPEIEPPLDVWSGWPKSVRGESSEEKNRIERIRENFAKEFSDYELFLKNPQEDTLTKISACKNLIDAKNTVIDALLAGNLNDAKRRIEVFRENIEIAKKEWENKISPEIKTFEKRKTLRHIFEEGNKKIADLEATILSLSTKATDLEREVFARHLAELKRDTITLERRFAEGEAVTEEEVGLYLDNFDPTNEKSIAFMLVKKEDTLSRIYGYKNTLGLKRPTIFGDPRLRRKALKNETAPELSPETRAILVKTHQEFIEEDPIKYINVYSHKQWVRNDPQEEIVKKILEKYKKGEEDKLLFLDDEKKIHETLLSAELNPEKIEILKKEIVAIENKIAVIATVLKKFDSGSQEDSISDKTFSGSLRETYSPASDPTSIDVGRNREDLTLRGKIAFDGARRKRSLPGEKKMTDEQLHEARTTSSLLSREDPLSRNTGMVRDVTREQAVIHTTKGGDDPNGFNHIEEVPREAIANDDLEKIEEERKSELEKKKRSVGNLLKTITSARHKIPGNTRQIIVYTSIAVASMVALQQSHNNKEGLRTPQTAGEAVSWKDSLGEDERNFLKDLIGDEKLNFINLAKKYAPSVKIDPNNPSTVRALSEFECKKLLDSPDPVYGLTPEQRVEVCRIVRHFERIVQAADRNKKGGNPSFAIPSPYQYVDHTMNLENFYTLVTRIATEEENKELIQRKK